MTRFDELQSRQICEATGCPALNTGGTVGTAAYLFGGNLIHNDPHPTQRQLPTQIDSLSATVERLQSLVDRLDVRLSPVLRAEPSSACAKVAEKESLVLCAQALLDSNIRLFAACDRLESIVDRLEL